MSKNKALGTSKTKSGTSNAQKHVSSKEHTSPTETRSTETEIPETESGGRRKRERESKE